jgi:uncharacterized protein YndB with AHSA1/START domain
LTGWTIIWPNFNKNSLGGKNVDAKNNTAFVIERTYDAPVAVVWQAITDPAAIKQWFMNFEGFVPEPGCEFRFVAEDHDNVSWEHLCVVQEVVLHTKLAYKWRYAGQPGDTLVTMELFPEGNRTRIKLTHAGLETLPTIPAFARENFVAGWTALIGSLLKAHVAQQPLFPDREVVSTRLIDAPRERVFAAFSDPAQLAKWWGPNGFTNTINKFEFHEGGDWHLTMHGPDGTDYRNESVFVEIVEPERIVYDHLRTMHRFLMDMMFFDFGGKTRLIWRQRFESPEELERIKAFVPAANEQNFDRLEAHLKGESIT